MRLQRRFFHVAVAVAATSLAACGGGGGGSAVIGGGGGGGAPASVSGDMMALAPSRGWNYQGTNSSGSFTITTYADPQPINGATAVGVAAVRGTVPTVLTSATNFDNNLLAIGGFNATNAGYTVSYQVSLGSSTTLAGQVLVPSTLTQGQTFSPYPGVTATVQNVGTVAGAAACPTPANGAVVAYNVNGQTYTVTYVPGCGITQFVYPSGSTYTLVSVATYASIGQLGSARMARSVGWVSTVRSILGLEHNAMPAAHLRL
jgi:hypothetical protein